MTKNLPWAGVLEVVFCSKRLVGRSVYLSVGWLVGWFDLVSSGPV